MGGATRFFVLLSGPLPLIHHRRSSFLRHASHYHKFFRSPLQPSARILSSSFHSIRASRHVHSQVSTIGDDFGSFEDPGSANSMFSPDSYTWREWSQFLGGLISGGYFGRQVSGIELVADLELPAEFLSTANACLAFSLEREHLLGLLPRKDIEVLVESVSPCFFRDGDDSSRKMKLFLRGDETQVLDHDKAHIIDLFKFILSYARNPTVSSESNLYGRDLVESSVRNLLREICQLGFSNPDPNLQTANQFPDKYGLPRGPYGPKIEMKRGDWICPRCSFMNFARNVKCLECDEARPKRQLNGGEWECPQCDFFNYGRNTLCLRCDCRRPGAPSVSNINENFASGNDNGSRATKVDIDSKLAANEEKAQRWFSKISQLDGTSDSSSSIADEDFPEIMPLRKGVNRFVVSTRKTPLERRLANAQYKGNLGNNDGVPENNSNELSAANNSLEEKIGQRLDDIFGRTSPNSQSTNLGKEQGTSTNYTSSSSSGSLQYESLKGSNSNYVPFVPLPPDMFAKKPTNSTMESKVVGTDNNKSLSSGSNEWTGSASQSNEMKEVGGTPPRNETEKINEEKEDAEKSERWFKRVAELHNVTDLPSAISDEDFPEIMPIRKGENRFVVSKKKDRSLTSPAYKRHAAEQSGSSNFVPFVPFPPDYFAKKDKPSSDNSNSKATGAQSNNTRIGVDDGNNAQQADNQETQTSRFNSALRTGSSSWNSEASSSDYVKKESNHNASAAGNPSAASEVQNIREKWSGKSLEGSAVTEPDPLDMSEEAKAQRWFRRVAQIKDISELSQIPDEDFPSIMPMRQGVNRFVVSKRKTPLERRLTSPQYRRNLPIVSSDPPKRENDDS